MSKSEKIRKESPLKARALIVLGMHRSGTSALARVINLRGVDLGKNLIPPLEGNNEKGFWEHTDINTTNEKLLRGLNSSWDDVRSLPENWWDSDIVHRYKLEILSILERDFAKSSFWGLKDPRICRLLPAWHSLLEHTSSRPYFLIIVRNPLEVVASLSKRDGFSKGKSCLLWLKHLIDAEKGTRNSNRIFVTYEELLSDWNGLLLRIQRSFKFKWPVSFKKAKEELNSFLQRDLQHNIVHDSVLIKDKMLSKWVKDLYFEAKKAVDGDDRRLIKTVNEIEVELKNAANLYEPAISDTWKRYQIQNEMRKELNQQLQQLNLELGDLRDQFSKDQQTLVRLETETTHFQMVVREKDERVQQLGIENKGLSNQLAERDESIKDLNIRLTEREEAIKDLNLRVTQRDESIKDLNISLTEREEAIKDLNLRVTQRDGMIGGLRTQLEEREGELKEISTRLAERNEAFKRLSSQLAESKETTSDLSAQVDSTRLLIQSAKEELDLIYISKSWRLTEPLRAIRRLISLLYTMIRRFTSNSARAIWHNLPFNVRFKLVLKGSVFRAFPLLFKNTVAYCSWQSFETRHRIKVESDSRNSAEIRQIAIPEKHIRSVPLLKADPLTELPVKLIAFYLPQFHPIPENDKWWGEGFTEWTNVKRAVPQFIGHYQPHIPGQLGYYDLRSSEVQHRQVELAKLYGIGGFCFHFYWFGGKRLLEGPVKQYINNRSLDLPFCLCWANENWSRRWDGLEKEILIAQDHSKLDDLAFIEHVSRYLRDPRYIRIQGKPLLIVYRPSLLPSAKKTARRWRNWCRDNDIGEIYLAYTQSFESLHPRKYGFDGAIEFPPNNSAPPVITDFVKLKDSDFTGIVYDWGVFLERSRNYQKSDYPFFRGVCPGWDNTARRMNKATVFWGSTPVKYGKWLENAVTDTIQNFADSSERLVFVNAWNEWAEGAHLEPDKKYGYAYLQSTRDALTRIKNMIRSRRIILVSHDSHPHGAQYIIYHVMKILAEDFGFVVDMFVLGDGPLMERFERYATLHFLDQKDIRGGDVKRLLAGLYAEGVRSAIANTTVAGVFVEILKKQGFHVVSLIHELPGLIKNQKLQSHARSIAKFADSIVFPGKAVMKGFKSFTPDSLHNAIIRPQGLYKRNFLQNPNQIKDARIKLRNRFGLPKHAQIVLCVGFADYRKGIDLFVEIGLKALKKIDKVYFIWVGHLDSNIEPKITKLLDEPKFSDHFIFHGNHDFNTDLYYAGSDVFALTSREDPFPSVVLESLEVNLPVVAFDGVGGITELLSRGCGRLIPSYDTAIFANELIELLRCPHEASLLGKRGKAIVDEEFSMRHYVFDLVSLAKEPIKRVSVILPNYNYAHLLVERIKSIVNQKYPIYEIIILDDASNDESVQILHDIIPTLKIDCKLITNKRNSGNPFVQWREGVKIARGDYIWIAEADDLSDPQFLSEVLQPFDDPSIMLSYCQSKQIDSDCRILCDDYLDYVSDISKKKWKMHYVQNGIEEICTCLAIKNTIPNVSSVVFSKDILLKIMEEKIDEIKSYKIVGDWVVYSYILEYGKIAYSPKSLNLHRRHQNSLTISNFNFSQLEEILAIQQKVRNRFKLSREVILKAYAYSKSLYEYFNIATPEAAELEDHPSLKTYLKIN